MSEQHRLTFDDRREIERLRGTGMSARRIAKRIGCNFSTVYRELSRGLKDGYCIGDWKGYSAKLGQARYDENVSRRGKPKI